MIFRLISKGLNSVDAYGKPVVIKFNGTKSIITTCFGGFLTVLLVLLTLVYAYSLVYMAINDQSTGLVASNYLYEKVLTLESGGDANSANSLNMMLGIKKS